MIEITIEGDGNAAFVDGDCRKETIRILKELIKTLENGLGCVEDEGDIGTRLYDLNGGSPVGSWTANFWEEPPYRVEDLQQAWDTVTSSMENGLLVKNSSTPTNGVKVTTIQEWYEWDETEAEQAWADHYLNESEFPNLEFILGNTIDGLVI